VSPEAWWMLGITWGAVIGVSAFLFARLLRRRRR
jgi:hypothetical protein